MLHSSFKFGDRSKEAGGDNESLGWGCKQALPLEFLIARLLMTLIARTGHFICARK